MNLFIYWGVVLAGAITLLIEAYRNFNDSLTKIPFREHPILRDVEVAKLCTTHEKNVGFAFYSLLYLVTYVIALSSTEVYTLLSEAARSSTEIGPTDSLVGPANDPLDLTGAGYGKPIFISAAIISLFSIKALKPVEGTMRSLSHRLAGIPRGVYRVIETIHTIDFEKLKDEEPRPLDAMFTATFAASFTASHDAHQIPALRASLITIDYLAPAITGQLRVQHFPFTQLDAMGELSLKLEDQIAQLRTLMSGQSAITESDRAKLFEAAMLTANDTIALFAVHFIRNNRAIKNFEASVGLKRVHGEIGRDYQVELNSFAMSLLLSTIAATLFGFLVLLSWQKWENKITPDKFGQLVKAELSETAITEEAKAYADNCGKSPPAGTRLFDSVPKTFTSGALASDERCQRIWKLKLHSAINDRRYSTIVFVFREILPVLLAVALAALPAILGREVRRDDNSWPDWKLRRIPFLRLISMSLVPAALAVIGVASGAFVLHWAAADFHLTQSEMTFFFESRRDYFLMHAGLGMIVSIGVLVLSDQHDHHYDEITAILGLIIGIFVVAFYAIIVLVGYPPEFLRLPPEGAPPGVTFLMRETLLYGSCGMFFLFFYAIFVEMTEDPRKERGSWIVEHIFRRPFGESVFRRSGKGRQKPA